MATVTITIPDALIPRITAAARTSFPQYAALSDAATFKRITADYWVEVLAGTEGNKARTTSYTQAQTDASGIG